MKSKDEAFHHHLLHHMAGFQELNTSNVWSMKGFMDKNPDALKEQELFYRATDYRGS